MPLRLKSLELQGYKTFASRTLFEFSDGITAIVGPNGSGKSNIADALRWVLGEQSFGLLRAKKTEDMIFAGSESRTRAGMASASILFDNNDNWLPVDFSEVAMGRRAYRDGRNDYLLNGQHVRLREINELLAQSGLSERTYTILGQGLVDASLALKADERRRLFEEAAGVGLYRTRREETLRRLETTKRNLERVLDIMSEVEPRLRSLDRQARRAREYSRLQNDLRLVLLDWYGYHWHKAQQELNESREVLRQQEDRQNQARESFQGLQSEYVSFRKRVLELRAQLSDWHRGLSELHSQRETVSRELAILDERQRSLLNSSQAVSMERDRIEQEIKTSRERLEQAQRETIRVKDEFEEANTHLTSAQNSFESLQTNYQESARKLENTRASANKLHTRRVEAQARLDELASRRELQGERLATLTKSIQVSQEEYDRVVQTYQTSQSELEKIRQKIKNSEEELNQEYAQVELIDGKIRAKTEDLSNGNAAHSRLSAQLEVLDQAEQSLTGYAEGARFLLDAGNNPRLIGSRGVLSASLEIPAELEGAISAALGDQIDAVILAEKNLDEALKLLESEQAGRTALLALDRFGKTKGIKAPQDPDCLGVAATLIGYPEDLREVVNVLLGNTLIARDRDAAKRLLEGRSREEKVVTLQGEVFRGDGLVIAGKSSHGTIISRPRQRRELRDSLATLGEKRKTIEKEIRALASDLQIKQEQYSQSEKAHTELAAFLVEKQAAEREASAAKDSALRQLEWQKSQLEELHAEESRSDAEQQNYAKTQAEIDAQTSQVEEELRSLTNQFAEISLEESQEQVSYWTTRVAVAEQTLNDAKIREEERLISMEGLLDQSEILESRSNELNTQLKDVEEERKILKARELNLQTEISKLGDLIKPADEELSSAENQEGGLQAKEGESQRVMTAADRQFNQVQVEVIRRQEALETLRSRIQDDFGLVMFEYAQDVVGPMPLPLDGMVEQLPVIKELPDGLDAQLSQQRAQLRRMGPVNQEAENEYEKESQRFEFLKTQVEDLRKAEADLRQVISELDILTRQEFSKTFDAVDREFRQIFVRLFGGGSARLALTDPDNLVDTGIEIEARLPGRREQGLALLSGGERSLTAIALVFALLKVSPTPVCVMDEVDAMLDEANVGRFRELLFELSKDTQFIIITHNRNTVQVADVIYGVTMGRDSVSQIISLRLDEVTDEYIGT